jgi:hypothetical protein
LVKIYCLENIIDRVIGQATTFDVRLIKIYCLENIIDRVIGQTRTSNVRLVKIYCLDNIIDRVMGFNDIVSYTVNSVLTKLSINLDIKF